MSAMPADDRTWLGIDVGTQGVRGVLLDAAGEILATGTAPLMKDSREGARHEQDPQEWWSALCTASRTATAALGGRPLGGLAVSSTSGTLVVQDRAGHPLRPALMYDDARAVDEAQLAQGAGEALWLRLGYRVQRSWALPKLVWLQRAGELTGAIVAHQADHLTGRLTGGPTASDTSHSLKSGYDLVERRWPTDVLDALGVDPAVLPDVLLPGSVVGHVTDDAAAVTGIPAGTTVRAGMTDGCAAQIAARALTPGSWSTALGTTLVVKGATAHLLHDPSGAVYSHLNPDGGWLPGGASSTGAGIIARDFAGNDLAELTAQAATHLPSADVTYPLPGTGERFPFVAPDATGFTTGATTASPAERFAAVLQGVSLLERLAYDVLAGLGADISGPVTLSGGATRNHAWNQLRADVLGRPALLPTSTEAAVGMAVLAAAAPGRLGVTADAMVRITRTFEPDERRGEQFAEPYRQFCAALVDRGWLDPATLAGAA